MPTDASTVIDGESILAKARALGPAIEAAADDIARDRRLPADLLESMRHAGIFRIAFPRTWGGPEMDILQQCELMDMLGYHDASAAWVAMICSDSGHFAARVEESVARELYPDMDLLTAGWVAPVGQAHRVDGGFKVSGRWQFGSGCLHADRLIGVQTRPATVTGWREEWRLDRPDLVRPADRSAHRESIGPLRRIHSTA